MTACACVCTYVLCSRDAHRWDSSEGAVCERVRCAAVAIWYRYTIAGTASVYQVGVPGRSCSSACTARVTAGIEPPRLNIRHTTAQQRSCTAVFFSNSWSASTAGRPGNRREEERGSSWAATRELFGWTPERDAAAAGGRGEGAAGRGWLLLQGTWWRL